MERNIKDISKIILHKVKEYCIIKMEISFKDNFTIIKQMDMEFILIIMVLYIKDIG